MNRTIVSVLCILPMAGTLVMNAQAPALAPVAPQVNNTRETGKISRIFAGPGDRPEGILLRNGTFVHLPPGLAQQLPASLSKSSPVGVSGDLVTYNGNRTIEAHTLTIAGVAYSETAGAMPPQASAAPVPPPAGPATAGAPAGPPPPVPCAAGGPPPPPPPGAAPTAAPRNGFAAPATPPPPAGGVPVAPPPTPQRDEVAPPAAPPANNGPAQPPAK